MIEGNSIHGASSNWQRTRVKPIGVKLMSTKEIQNDKRNILVVDDEVINREFLKVILEADYDVLFAEDGAQAINMLREYKTSLSLILLDLLMRN